MKEMFPAVLGIDVSQKTLDVTLLNEKEGKRRKLMHLAFGVLKNKTPFDPAYAG